MAADTSLPRSYKFFYVKRTPDGFLHAAQQINKNTTFPGYNPIEGDWCLVVAPTGICVNGDYGTNPPLEEMREMADLMREAVEAFDHVSGEAEIARLRADVDAANARAAAAEAERDAALVLVRYYRDVAAKGDEPGNDCLYCSATHHPIYANGELVRWQLDHDVNCFMHRVESARIAVAVNAIQQAERERGTPETAYLGAEITQDSLLKTTRLRNDFDAANALAASIKREWDTLREQLEASDYPPQINMPTETRTAYMTVTLSPISDYETGDDNAVTAQPADGSAAE